MTETLDHVAEAHGTHEYRPSINEWLAAWPAIRSDALALLEEFRQQQPDYDPHWVEWVISEMDDAATNLKHRTLWLRRRLAEAGTSV